MPWLAASHVVDAPEDVALADAYCGSVEARLVPTTPPDGVERMLAALDARTSAKASDAHDAGDGLVAALSAAQGRDASVWMRAAALEPAAYRTLGVHFLPYIHDPTVPFAPLVHALTSLLLYAQATDVWDASDTKRLPVPTLTSLLERPGLDEASDEALYTFFAVFLDSVHAYLYQAYDHALKQLMHYLLEARQQLHEPEATRIRCRTLGVLLLERRVRCAFAASLAPHAAPAARLRGDPSVCAVLDLYATQVLAAGIAHRRLLRTAALALAHDAVKAANACLALPHVASTVQAERKRVANASGADADARVFSEALTQHDGALQGPTIAATLWHECALALCSSESDVLALGLYFLRATSIAALFFPAPVAETLAPRARPGGDEPPAMATYAARMLAAVVQARHAMATIAEQFGVASTSGTRVAWDAVLERDVDALVFLYACEARAIRSGATPTADVDRGLHFTRFETLHARFLEDASAAAASLDRFLRTYALVNEGVPSAVYAAPAFLETLDDVLHVLCDHHLGLFLPFVAWHPRPDAVHALDGRAAPVCLALWDRASEALAHIFVRVPMWSRTAARDELLAWLPRVPALASFMVKRVAVTTAAVVALDDPAWSAREVVAALAMPLDSAIGWLRLNHKELLQELADYIRRVVQTFSKASMPLPAHVTQHAVDFLTQQLDIAEVSERKTLLSTAQLELLLDEFLALPKEGRTPKAAPKPTPATLGLAPGASGGKLRQQTLSFAPRPADVVDLTGDSPRNQFRAAAAVPSSGTPGLPRLGVKPAVKPGTGRTGFGKGAPSAPSASGPPSRLSQLRSEFQQTRNTARRPHAPVRTLEPDEPRAPLAMSSVTGTIKPAPAPRRPPSPSDSDSSSSDDEGGGGAAGLRALRSPRKAAPTKPTAPVRRGVVLLDDSALQKTMRRARDDGRVRRLRTAPDLSELHRCILAWDMASDAEHPPTPPDSQGAVLTTHARAVPPTFADSGEYMRVYGALFLLECWAQFQQAKEELQASDLLPVGMSMGGTVNELVRLDCKVQPPAKWTLSDADVVCLQNSSGLQLLAKVQSVEGRGRELNVSVLCHPNSPAQRTAVQQASSTAHTWQLGKLFSLVTLRREYAALLSVPDLGLVDDILHARAARRAEVSDADIAAGVRRFGVNPPQARAVLGAMRTPGFSLIQGPPGTGKTKTISALVATFLQRRRSGASGAKLLLCAPSNAAIDEIVARIQHGVHVDGRTIQPRVVRIGREDAVNPAVRDTTLEAAVERRRGQRTDAAAKQQAARARLAEIERQWQNKEQELVRAQDAVVARQLQAELNVLTDQRLEAREEHESLARAEKSTASMDDARRHHVRVDVLNEAEVVCATLAGAGHELLYPLEFDTVIIDEAVQAVELSTLIPLRYNCTRCILVGDPKQLPPTVISQEAERLGYSQSLFVRMYAQAPQNVYLLSIQYRMHPHISLFPSTTFYGGQLADGDAMAQRTAQPWHAVPLFAPFRMLDVRGSEDTGRGHSLVNRAEAEAAIALYDALQTHARTSLAGRVGFITMYKAQVALMRSLFRARYGAEALDDATFNTVDGFQGQEKDVVILSCVRSNARNAIGFLGDERRLNVALTRARSNMFVLGDTAMLERASPVWEKLVREARNLGYLVRIDAHTFRAPTRVQTSVAAHGPPTPARALPEDHSTVRPAARPPTAPARSAPPAKRPRHDAPPSKAAPPLAPAPKATPPPRAEPLPKAAPPPKAAPINLLDKPSRATAQTTRLSTETRSATARPVAPPTVGAARAPPDVRSARAPSGTPSGAAPPGVPAKRPAAPLPPKPNTHPASLPSKPSIPPTDTPQEKKGKWAAIVERSKQKPTAPRPTPIAPGESRGSDGNQAGPSWLRSARPSMKR